MKASEGIEIGKAIVEGFTKGIGEGIVKMENKTLDIMRDYVEVQGRKGNYNYDNYMMGMYNGMELMLATAEGREPEYRSFKDEKKSLKDKWIEARDQVKDMVSNETETLPVFIFHSGDLESFKAFEYPEEANPHNFTPQEIEGMVNEAFDEAPMDLEDYVELVEFQKREIAKLREQKNELKGRILENIQGVAETSKERDLWKLTSELLYDRLKDALSILNKDK